MKKILVTGAGGFVGSRVMQQWAGRYELCTFPKGFLAAAGEDAVQQAVLQQRPDVILHTAAISDTGYCADHPEQAYRSNVELPVWFARAAAETGAKLVAFSSDQVYAGVTQSGPLPETISLQPANVYGQGKLEMEQRVLDRQPDSVLLRAEWMYDYISPKGNYLLNVLNAKETLTFGQQYRGITYLREVCENMERVIKLPGGIYNFGSETTQSMYEITKDFLRITGSKQMVKEVPAAHNLWMDCGKAAEYGVVFSDVMDGLKRCLGDYGLI